LCISFIWVSYLLFFFSFSFSFETRNHPFSHFICFSLIAQKSKSVLHSKSQNFISSYFSLLLLCCLYIRAWNWIFFTFIS
jgi:hypothetical protein